jgi:hypothetical protein
VNTVNHCAVLVHSQLSAYVIHLLTLLQEDAEYNDIDAYLLVYSIDERDAFKRAVDCLYTLRKDELKTNAAILVGNKCDLVRSRHVTPDGMYYQ